MFETFERILGVDLVILQNGSFRCDYALVIKKGNDIDASAAQSTQGNIVKILQDLPKGYPVALSIGGKGVIHKQLAATGKEDNGLFKEAFPSVDGKDFYVQQTVQNQVAWMSIVRKSLADDILSKMQLSGLDVYAWSLGGLPVISVWELLSGLDQGFAANGHEYLVSAEGLLKGYREVDGLVDYGSLKMGGSKMESRLLLPYALAFQLFLLGKIPAIGVLHSEVDGRLQQFLENSKLKKMAGYFVFSLLCLLMISFLALRIYNKENAQLSEQVGAITASADRGDLLKKEIARQKILLNKLGWNGGYNYAFLLHEIGDSKPRALQLNQVKFNPLLSAEVSTEQSGTVEIVGETINLSAVNNWIFLFKEKIWVKEIKLLRYQQPEDSESFVFNLLIRY